MCRELVLDVLVRQKLTGNQDTGRLQLIVDEETQHVLNSFLRMTDLTDEGITSVELLHRHREPLPDLDAMYILRPDAENLQRVLDDFGTQGRPQHFSAHLGFTQFLTSEHLGSLASSPHLAQRVRSIVEVPLSFVTVQDRGFHFNMPDALPRLFPVPEPVSGDDLVSGISHCLSDVCRVLQCTKPNIRVASSNVCRTVAERMQQELDLHSNARVNGGGKQDVPCQLLIVDRSVDIAATLVHEFSYEAMAYDLLDGSAVLDVNRNVVNMHAAGNNATGLHGLHLKRSKTSKSLGSSRRANEDKASGKEVLLSDKDTIWEELKHLHVSTARDEIQRMVEEFVRSNGPKDASELSTTDLLEMLRKSPEHKDTIEKLQVHMLLLQELFQAMECISLSSDLGALEQDIACGIDKNGKEVKASNLVESLMKILSKVDGAELPSETKLRLLMLYLACMVNVPESVKEKLVEQSSLEPKDQQVMLSMLRMKLAEVPDERRLKVDSLSAHRGSKEEHARFKRNTRQDGRFELSRYEPRVKQLLEDMVAGVLNEEEFSHLIGPSSDAGTKRDSRPAPGTLLTPTSAAPADDWIFGSTGRTQQQQRVVLFIIGGVTHSELRAAAEIAQELPRGTEVFVGGTSLVTPKRFVQMLRPSYSLQSDREDPANLV